MGDPSTHLLLTTIYIPWHSFKEMIMSDCGLHFLFAFEQNLSGIIQKTLLKVVHRHNLDNIIRTDSSGLEVEKQILF